MSELRRLRRAMGLTQEQLAEQSGVSAFTITEIERGKRTPYPSTLSKLATTLGVTTGELMGEATVDFRAHWLALHTASLDQATDTIAEVRKLMGDEKEWKKLPYPERERRINYIRRYVDILDHAVRDAATDAKRAFQLETGETLE